MGCHFSVTKIFNIFLRFPLHQVKGRVKPVDGCNDEHQHFIPQVMSHIMGQLMGKDKFQFFQRECLFRHIKSGIANSCQHRGGKPFPYKKPWRIFDMFLTAEPEIQFLHFLIICGVTPTLHLMQGKIIAHTPGEAKQKNSAQPDDSCRIQKLFERQRAVTESNRRNTFRRYLSTLSTFFSCIIYSIRLLINNCTDQISRKYCICCGGFPSFIFILRLVAGILFSPPGTACTAICFLLPDLNPKQTSS